MSLEQQIIELVEASNELTETVANKQSEIDLKVNTKINEIDAKITQVENTVVNSLKTELNQTHYVSKTGNDETGTGTSANPFATIKHAIQSVPYNARVRIILQGGATKETAHIIDETIDIGMRHVEIMFSSNHIVIADGLSAVFRGTAGSTLYFSEGNGGHEQHVHINTSTTLLVANGDCVFHMGGYDPCTMYIADSAELKLISVAYTGSARGISRLSCSRLNLKNADGSAVTNATVIGCDINVAGAAFIHMWSSSLGNNYSDTLNPVNTSVISGALKIATSR